MPVIINEFEVIEQAPRQLARAEEPQAAEGEQPRKADPLEVWFALRAIENHAVRVWAH